MKIKILVSLMVFFSYTDTWSVAKSGATNTPQNVIRLLEQIEPDGLQKVEWTRKSLAAHRAREVHLGEHLSKTVHSLEVGDQISFPLFHDAVIEAKINKVTKYVTGVIGITAKLENRHVGTMYMAYIEGRLRMFANIRGSNNYHVRYDPATKLHIALEEDHSLSHGFKCATSNKPFTPAQDNELTFLDAEPTDELEIEAATAVAVLVVKIHVLVLYTEDAKTAMGGEDEVLNSIGLSMEVANQAHDNSFSGVELVLADAIEIDYSTSGDIVTDWNYLRGTSDGVMDDVHTLRYSKCADLVSLVVDLGDVNYVSGYANVLDDPSGDDEQAFGVVDWEAVGEEWGWLVFTHELAHNMGCEHSKSQTSSPWAGKLFSYSAGWQWEDSSSAYDGYCTIMTYEDHDNDNTRDYTRIAYFSNPDVSYMGNDTGDTADADNARTIRETKTLIRDYRYCIYFIPHPHDIINPWFFPWLCDFDPRLCFPFEDTGELSWQPGFGPSSNYPYSGPLQAFSGSNYTYLSSMQGDTNKTGILRGHFNFHNLTMPELEFAYHMHGADMGALYAEASVDKGATWQVLWSVSGSQNDIWQIAKIDLSGYAGTNDVGIRIRGVTGSGPLSDIAVDRMLIRDKYDIDWDGLPNFWENLYFGGPTNAVVTSNMDGDFFTTGEEYIAGLNPLIFDTFTISNLNVGLNTTFEWAVRSGRVYNVYWTDSLMNDSYVLIQSNLTTGAYTDELHVAEPQGFYKLEVQVAP